MKNETEELAVNVNETESSKSKLINALELFSKEDVVFSIEEDSIINIMHYNKETKYINYLEIHLKEQKIKQGHYHKNSDDIYCQGFTFDKFLETIKNEGLEYIMYQI